MKCLECGKDVKSIGYKHLKSCSGITTKEYKIKYPDASMMDEDIIKKCVHYGEANKVIIQKYIIIHHGNVNVFVAL